MKRCTVIITISVATLLLIVAGTALVTLNTRTANDEPTRIYLRQATPDAIKDTLTAYGIVDSWLGKTIVRLATTALGDSTYTGSYLIEPNDWLVSLMLRMHRGNQDPVKVTIGVHRTPQSLSQHLSTMLMDTIDIPLDSFHLYRPDTYELYWTTSQEGLMRRIHREYDAFWKKRDTTRCDLTRREAIVLASIVDEETNYEPEMPTIASVYLNRLRKGMPLQADPTVRYAMGDFTIRRVTSTHLKHESPFNTYLHAGLPPAPICLPSAKAVDDVLNAPQTDYLYFCASEKLDGTHLFARTLAEHQNNAQRYHRAITQRGIK